jgi:hypothetical protein
VKKIFNGYSRAELDAFGDLVAGGATLEEARIACKISVAKFRKFLEAFQVYVGKIHQPGLEIQRSLQLARTERVFKSALSVHKKVEAGISREKRVGPDGEVTLTERQEVPNSRALDTAIKAVQLQMELSGTKVQIEEARIRREAQETLSQLTLALGQVLLPNHEHLYLRVIAQFEKIRESRSI